MQSGKCATLRDTVLAVVGNWEPLFHRIRSGNYHVDEQELYAFEHTEDMAQQLANEGINLVLMHFYKGMGFEFEKPEMEKTHDFIAACHNHSIMVGTYTQWGTFWAETFLEENPNALDFCQKDLQGMPSMYSETYWAYHRYRTCCSSLEFRDFLKKIIRYSVEQIGTDLVYLDNVGQNPCYCLGCQKGFRKFLQKRYPTPAQFEARCGLRNTDFVKLPYGSTRNPIDSMEIISDPIVQEWIQFRCEQLHSSLDDISQFLKTLKRQVPFAFNPPILYGDNAPLVWGTDVFRILKTSTLFYSEDGNISQLTPDSRIISQHRVYKTADYFNNTCMRFHSHRDLGDDVNPELLAISEAAVLNNGNLATVKYYGSIAKSLHPRKQDYIKFFRRHESCYTGVKQLSECAVYKNFESLTWAYPQVYPNLTVLEQLLIQGGVQYSYIINDDFDRLLKSKVLVIPDIWCISQQQAIKIADWVKAGGKLLVLGKTGTRDLDFRKYRVNVLAKALGHNSNVNIDANFIALGGGAGGGFRDLQTSIDMQWHFGHGTVIWLPEIVQQHKLNDKIPGQIRFLDNSFWDIPANWQVILASLDSLLGGRWIPIEVKSAIVPQVSFNTRTGETIIHLLNYNCAKEITDLQLNIRTELTQSPKIFWRTPETLQDQQIEYTLNNSKLEITVPEFQIHGSLIFQN